MHLSIYIANRNQAGIVIVIGYDGLRLMIKYEVSRIQRYFVQIDWISIMTIEEFVISIAVEDDGCLLSAHK